MKAYTEPLHETVPMLGGGGGSQTYPVVAVRLGPTICPSSGTTDMASTCLIINPDCDRSSFTSDAPAACCTWPRKETLGLHTMWAWHGGWGGGGGASWARSMLLTYLSLSFINIDVTASISVATSSVITININP